MSWLRFSANQGACRPRPEHPAFTRTSRAASGSLRPSERKKFYAAMVTAIRMGFPASSRWCRYLRPLRAKQARSLTSVSAAGERSFCLDPAGRMGRTHGLAQRYAPGRRHGGLNWTIRLRAFRRGVGHSASSGDRDHRSGVMPLHGTQHTAY